MKSFDLGTKQEIVGSKSSIPSAFSWPRDWDHILNKSNIFQMESYSRWRPTNSNDRSMITLKWVHKNIQSKTRIKLPKYIVWFIEIHKMKNSQARAHKRFAKYHPTLEKHTVIMIKQQINQSIRSWRSFFPYKLIIMIAVNSWCDLPKNFFTFFCCYFSEMRTRKKINWPHSIKCECYTFEYRLGITSPSWIH